jgi:subtilisin family serine protease
VDGDCAVLPAQLPGVLTVSAVGAARAKSSYSSYGAGVVDVAAPGGDMRQRAAGAGSGCVLSTVPGGYRGLCGTSMATPHAAGVAALVASAHPEADAGAVAQIVRSTATPLPCPGGRYDPDSNGSADATCASDGARTGFYGYGLLNADAAVG